MEEQEYQRVVLVELETNKTIWIKEPDEMVKLDGTSQFRVKLVFLMGVVGRVRLAHCTVC